jgi:hypothetical protein
MFGSWGEGLSPEGGAGMSRREEGKSVIMSEGRLDAALLRP